MMTNLGQPKHSKMTGLQLLETEVGEEAASGCNREERSCS
jgi:hypothetical protein